MEFLDLELQGFDDEAGDGLVAEDADADRESRDGGRDGGHIDLDRSLDGVLHEDDALAGVVEAFADDRELKVADGGNFERRARGC